ncbi:MAG: hypothetical protein ACK5IM_04970, partial [Demequina sp.]|uniref:hypothetical protein n=1 Tax=Demequina sp. TaxID=2050685 RepID=UPI003A8602A6
MKSLILRGAYDRVLAAEYLSCSPELLRQYVSAGMIAPRYHGTKPVYLRDDLEALLESLPD